MRATGFSVVVKALIRDRAAGCCELCGEWSSDMQHHHRRPRQMGGTRRLDTNTASGCLLLCGSCHRRVESHRALAYDNGWLVHQGAKPSDVPVLRRGEWVKFDDLGGFELVRNVMCDNGKSPDQVLEWGDPAPAETGPGLTDREGSI